MTKYSLKKQDFFYSLGIFLLSFITIAINGSLLAESLLPVQKVLQYVILFLFAYSFLQDRWSIKNLIISVLLFVLIAYVGLKINRSMVIVNIVAFIAFNKKNIKQVLSTIMWSNIISVGIVLVLCGLGVIENLQFDHNGQTAYGLGFYYYTNLSFYVFYISVIAIMLEEKKQKVLLKCYVLLVLNFIVYLVTTTRLTFYLFVLLVLLYTFITIKRNIKYSKLMGMMCFLIYPACAFFSVDLAVNHTDAITWRRQLNEWTMNRPLMGKRALFQYGINLFGNEMEFDTSTVQNYFYVDNGYMYSLLAYGIIVFIVLIILYSVLTYLFAKKESWKLVIWAVIMAIFSIVNNGLFTVIYNPLLLFLPELIRQSKYMVKEKRSL